MLDLKEPPVPPFTPERGRGARGPTTPKSGQSGLSFGNVESSGGTASEPWSFPASSYRSSTVLETGSAIPLQFAAPDEPREIQIRRARDSIVEMSSVLSDLKSQRDTVRRASSSSVPAAEPVAPSSAERRAERAARVTALGAPWMPPQSEPQSFPPPHGPPPAFKAPMSPLSPPQRPRRPSRSAGSPQESYATAEEQVSEEDFHGVEPTFPRLTSSNWRELLSPSPPKGLNPRSAEDPYATSSGDPHSANPQPRNTSALRLAALGDDDVDDEDAEVRMRGSFAGDDGDETPEVLGVREAVSVRKVRQVPTVLEVPPAHVARVRETRAVSDTTPRSADTAAPAPPTHGARTSSRRHHRYHSMGVDPELEPPGHYARGEAQSVPRPAVRSPSQPSQPSHAQPLQPSHAQPSHAQPKKGHARAQSHHHRKRAQDDALRKRNFTKKSITDLVQKAPPDHVYDLDEIDMPGPERRLLEKFVDSLSKLSIEIQMEEGKREEGRRRLRNALRALEGWI